MFFREDTQKIKKRTKHLIFEYQKETDSDAVHQPGLNIQKKETEEQKSVTEEQNTAIKMEIVEDDSPSTSNQTFPINETSECPKIQRLETSTVIDLTERVDVARNTDLFKAIFLDSESEGEEEKEKEEIQNKTETLKNTVLNDSLLPKIKAKKDGILANLDFSQLAPAVSKIPSNSIQSSTSENSEKPDDLSYGPQMPLAIVNKTTNVSFTVEVSDDEWVEKDSECSKEKKSVHKHKKKHKKDKHEHKKKHKHDKKKK